MKCIHCDNQLDKDRTRFIEITGKFPTCVNCSKEQPVVSMMNYGHKTAGEVLIVPNNPNGTNNAEFVRQAKRAYRRGR